MQVGVEQFALLGSEVLGHLFVDALDVRPGLADGAFEDLQFRVDVRGFLVGYQFEACGGQHHVGRADPDAGHAGHAPETGLGRLGVAGPRQSADVAGRLGMADVARDLGGERGQERHFVLLVAPLSTVLDDEDAENLAHVHDGYAQECVEDVLGQSGDLGEAFVRGALIQVHGLGAFGDEPDKTFMRGQRHVTDHVGVEPFVGDHGEPSGGAVAQVDGTHFRIEDHRHAGHEEVEAGAEARCGTEVLDDLAEGVEHPSAP